jgi:hypothetical protein
VLLFAFQGAAIIKQPLVIALLAVPILIQVFFNSALAYWLNKVVGEKHNVACPSALIGASNFFELAVAAAISLFGFESGAALATVVGVLIEVPVMLLVVKVVNASKAGTKPEPCKEKIMKKLEVFDPAMCCSTGVCGVDVDPVLAQFAADLKWVEAHDVTVERHNLGQEPQAFAANPAVLKEMEAGMDRLPILTVDGHIVSTGMYPSRAQLAQKLGIVLTTAEKPRIKAGGCGCKPGTC